MTLWIRSFEESKSKLVFSSSREPTSVKVVSLEGHHSCLWLHATAGDHQRMCELPILVQCNIFYCNTFISETHSNVTVGQDLYWFTTFLWYLGLFKEYVKSKENQAIGLFRLTSILFPQMLLFTKNRQKTGSYIIAMTTATTILIISEGHIFYMLVESFVQSSVKDSKTEVFVSMIYSSSETIECSLLEEMWKSCLKLFLSRS